jgi:hypothetical protein
MNVAQFAAVDPVWDNDLGSGMLNVFQALDSATASDPGFPSCVGPPANPGQPCALSGLPSWNNNIDLSTAAAPQVGVANTITAQVRNDGPNPVTILVNFGVYIFAVGNNQFFHIGSQPVTIPAFTTVAVNQPWTPAATNHQCLQVSIDFGADTDYTNNVTQRNLQVSPSVYEVRIENPFFTTTTFEVRSKSDRDGWICEVGTTSFKLNHFMDCPRTIRVRFDAPPNARPGEIANCDIGVFATPEGGKEQLIGGVTVATFVPRPCRVVGSIVDASGRPIGKAAVRLRPQGDDRSREAVSVESDEEGIFSARIASGVSYDVSVDAAGKGRGSMLMRLECGIGALKFELTPERGLLRKF